MLIICGPTASGKTAAAIELALSQNLEVVSADSGQVYRGLDIGTAKPTPEERKGVRFHLIDLLGPDEQFSAADFRVRATNAIREIESRGNKAIVVGGTGLYLKALEEGLFEGPSRDLGIRAELERRIQEEGVESLHRELQKVDPAAAKTIPPKNRHRIIRALEVHRLTGRPISEFWKEHRSEDSPFVFQKVGILLPKEEQHLRIATRVDGMVKRGLVEEVRLLVKKWGPTAPALRLIGYKEIVAHLEGRISLDEAVSLIKQNTRQYAKRQTTWFRRDRSIRWVSDIHELAETLPTS